MSEPGLQPAPPPAWEYLTETLPLGTSPDFAALGAGGWEYVAAHPDVVKPNPLPQKSDALTFVFKRPRA